MRLRIIQYVTSVVVTYLLTSVCVPTSVRQHIHFCFYYFLYIYGKMHVGLFRNFVKFNQTCRCGFFVVADLSLLLLLQL